MKKIKFLCLSAIILTASVSCQKEVQQQVEETKLSTSLNAVQSYKDIAGIVLNTALSNSTFRTIAYEECNKQKYGDYYVKLNELIKLNENNNFWDKPTVDKLILLQTGLKDANKNDVVIFIPSIEKHPEKALPNNMQARSNRNETPIAVIGLEYDNPTKTCPGYIVSNGSTLTFYQTINESFAWENDVWVVGEEEIVSPENMVAAVEDTAVIDYSRMDGDAEYGGIVKVTDWSLVEPWILGKPEFRMVVYQGTGTTAPIKDKKFGKWRRAHFNNKFYDFGLLLYYWNLTNIGQYTTEKWIEEDGGTLFTLNFGIKFKVGPVEANVGVSLPIKNNDDDLGLSLVQFSDPIGTEYSMTGIDVKRRN